MKKQRLLDLSREKGGKDRVVFNVEKTGNPQYSTSRTSAYLKLRLALLGISFLRGYPHGGGNDEHKSVGAD